MAHLLNQKKNKRKATLGLFCSESFEKQKLFQVLAIAAAAAKADAAAAAEADEIQNLCCSSQQSIRIKFFSFEK